MGMKKAGAVVAAPQAVVTPPVQNTDSGTNAAVDRLTAKKETTKAESTSKSAYKPRDFDAEARGKTRCVQWEAAVMSTAIAGMKFKTHDEYLALVRKTADAGVAYTFGEDLPK